MVKLKELQRRLDGIEKGRLAAAESQNSSPVRAKDSRHGATNFLRRTNSIFENFLPRFADVPEADTLCLVSLINKRSILDR